MKKKSIFFMIKSNFLNKPFGGGGEGGLATNYNSMSKSLPFKYSAFPDIKWSVTRAVE